MKMFDCVLTAAVLLQMDDVCDYLAAEPRPENDSENRNVQLLVRCANLALGEVAADWFPLCAVETVNVRTGEIPYEKFSRRVCDILRVEKRGRRVNAGIAFDRIYVSSAGEYTITYTYAHEFCPLNGQTGYKDERVSARVLAYGTACEYSLIGGMTEEAALWDKKFKDALSAIARKKGEARLPARRWL